MIKNKNGILAFKRAKGTEDEILTTNINKETKTEHSKEINQPKG
jgi:hypothetical protein